jgi:hypothetical protein
MSDMQAKAQDLHSRAMRLFNSTERKNAEEQWALLAEYILPNQSGIFVGEQHSGSALPQGSTTPGGKKTSRLYDSTAIQSNSDLASAIHSTLTNPATKWSKIRFKQDELNNDDESVAWLEAVNNIIHSAINESNFDTEVAKNYKMYTALGSMVLMHESAGDEDDGNTKLRFKAVHLSEIVWEENNEGRADTVYRSFKLTAKQAAEQFGLENLSDAAREKAEDKPNEEIRFMHCVFPRKKKDVKINDVGRAQPKHRPFASIYLDMEDKHIVEEGGFYEFPFHVVRWETMPSERYGRGPGHIALPDIRTLNRAKELGLHALNKAINPPMLATRRDVLGSLDLRPGQITVMNDINGLRPLESSARFDVSQFATEELKQAIKSMFFLDKLLLPPRNETGEMTAYETQVRTEQMQRVLGPTLGRLNSELLSPLIVRTFKIALRSGALPPIPPAVQTLGLDVEIVFLNQLARSQQFGDITNIQGWVNELGLIAQLKPEIIDHINADGIAKHLAKVRGIPEVAVTNDDELNAMREQRAQAQQAQQMMEAGVSVADMASKLGGPNGGENQ